MTITSSINRLSPPAAILRHAVLLAAGALILVPFVWMVSLSIKSPCELFRASFSFWPAQFYGIENYTRALTEAPLPRYMGNGLIVCAMILMLQILVRAPCAYALAKLRFPGRDLLFGLVLIGLLLPDQVLSLPLPAVIAFSIFSVVSHWNELFWPLIVVHSESLMPPPLGIMAFRNEEVGNDYGPLMAAAAIVVLPLVVAFLAAQK
ncbi:carbohydrate ABC transporter permease [Bradyrhizobium sp. B120]|uniref:carbohydrate ABC transporter permease n=1 Tax=Bradyrhizobium sp. B120 TaxID=3410088 RepID=UPI003B983F66